MLTVWIIIDIILCAYCCYVSFSLRSVCAYITECIFNWNELWLLLAFYQSPIVHRINCIAWKRSYRLLNRAGALMCPSAYYGKPHPIRLGWIFFLSFLQQSIQYIWMSITHVLDDHCFNRIQIDHNSLFCVGCIICICHSLYLYWLSFRFYLFIHL